MYYLNKRKQSTKVRAQASPPTPESEHLTYFTGQSTNHSIGKTPEKFGW